MKRPLWCCGTCPEASRLKYDCTCHGNPKCSGPTCPTCDHKALDHHGVDPTEGCLALGFRDPTRCTCKQTATQAALKAQEQTNENP